MAVVVLGVVLVFGEDTQRPCWLGAGTAGSQHKPAVTERRTPRSGRSLVGTAEMVVVVVVAAAVEHTRLGCSVVVVA